jgi:hypothetical protein
MVRIASVLTLNSQGRRLLKQLVPLRGEFLILGGYPFLLAFCLLNDTFPGRTHPGHGLMTHP